MENLVELWLESIDEKSYAPQFQEKGFDSLQKCAELTKEDLERIGVTDDSLAHYFLDKASALRGRTEEEIVQELLVRLQGESTRRALFSITNNSAPLHSPCCMYWVYPQATSVCCQE